MTTRLVNVPVFDDGLGMAAACIRRWILERRIASVKVGRLVKVPESKAKRIIASGLRPGKEA
jgi:hypothetical protein